MNLPDLEQLDKVIALCRKRGVRVIKIDNVEITLSEEAPPKQTRKSKKQQVEDSTPDAEFDSDLPSDLELLFASCGGVPEEFKEGL